MNLRNDLPALHRPAVSVVICNYNYERYIGAALDSVLAQTYPAIEIVVVDDGSTDGSVDAVRQYAAAHSHVRIISQANGGQIAAYNTGFAQVRGEVVFFLDSDDMLRPNALEVVASSFAQGIAKVHFKLELIGPEGQPCGAWIPDRLAKGHVAKAFLESGVPHASPPASGNAYRRSVLEKIFPLPASETDRHGADFFCIYGATLFGDVAVCPGVLGLYRVHKFPRDAESLTFGNAEKGHVLDKRLQARLARFSAWMAERTQGAIQGPARLLDFSVEKSVYATTVMARTGVVANHLAAMRKLPTLISSILVRDDFGIAKKLGLMAWAGLLLLAPRPFALPLARYVCDPGSRGQRKGQAS